jgi:hypothetical protein
MEVVLPPSRYAADPQIADGFDRLTAAVRRVPGVVAASATSSLPLAGGGFYLGRVFLEENQPEPPASADTPAAWSVIQPGYFATVGIPVLEGRAFTSYDAVGSAPVIIISRAMAKQMLLLLFGLTALVLAAIGTYGIVAYAVTQRTREIGIRMALGAARTDVVAMVVWKALRLAAALLLLGVVVAAACIPAARASRVDPMTALRDE